MPLDVQDPHLFCNCIIRMLVGLSFILGCYSLSLSSNRFLVCSGVGLVLKKGYWLVDVTYHDIRYRD